MSERKQLIDKANRIINIPTHWVLQVSVEYTNDSKSMYIFSWNNPEHTEEAINIIFNAKTQEIKELNIWEDHAMKPGNPESLLIYSKDFLLYYTDLPNPDILNVQLLQAATKTSILFFQEEKAEPAYSFIFNGSQLTKFLCHDEINTYSLSSTSP